MARVALLKLFTGLNLGVSQLSGDLLRAGHETRIIYLKDFLVVSKAESAQYLVTDYALSLFTERGAEVVWNCYRPFTEREYALLREALAEFRPDVIGFSLTSLTMKVAAEVTARLRQWFAVPIIWGGVGPTLEPEWALGHADLVCVGEGEEPMVALAARLDAGADYRDVPGLWLRRDGETIRNPAPPLPPLDSIAIPDFSPARTIHVGDDRLARDFNPIFPPNQYPIMTQRGCPFSCSFCVESVYQDMFGKKGSLRRRSVDVVIEELHRAKRMPGVNQIMFYDDVFTVNPRWLREFAPRYKAEIGLPFWCYTYPTTTRKDDLELLRDAGLRSVTMGIQTGSERILREEFHRPVARERAYEAARVIAEAGVPAFFDLITKVHFERDADCRETFRFLLDLPLHMQSIGFGAMVNFPEYGYTKRVETNGVALTLSDRDYDYYHRLYLLTRTRLPRAVKKAIAALPLVRRFPRLLDPLLPKALPRLFLIESDTADDGLVNTSYAQGVRPGRASPAERLAS